MVSIVSVDPPDRWLKPSAALTRFSQPAGAMPGVRPRAAGSRTRFGFRVGQFSLLIKPGARSEVVTPAAIAPLPNVPAWFLGLMNLRGHLLPVFDLHQLLDTDQPERDRRTVLILDQGSDAVGLPIDGLPQPVGMAPALRHRPPLPDIIEAHVSTAYAIDRTIWFDFDHESFCMALGTQIAR